MFHYTDCGLDNVYLANGFSRVDGDYGEGYTIQDTPGLHKAIGLWLTDLPKGLTGAELRFFRLELEMTQRDLAGVLGATEQSVRRWEKARDAAVPGSADRLLRALYREYVNGDGSVRRMVDRLASLDEVEHACARFRDTRNGWVSEVYSDSDITVAANDDFTPSVRDGSLIEA